MLQKLRDQTQGTGFKILVGALIVVLTLFGFGATSLFMGNDPEIARVGDYSITQNVLNVETERERQRILSQMGPDFDPASIDRLQLQDYVISQVISRQVVYQAADELGVRVPPDTVNDTLVSSEAYQVDGQFDPDLYRNYVRMLGYTPVDFLNEFTNALSAESLRNGITETAVVSDWELGEVIKVVNQRRDMAYLPLSVDYFGQQVEVSEEDVEIRYEEDESQFMTDLTLDVEYISLSVDDLMDDESIEVTEEDMVSLYEQERSQALRDEQRDSSHILIQINDDRSEEQARELITELATRLSAGETFSALAQEFSEDPGSAQQGGSLGPLGKGIFDPAFEEALWALGEVGDVTSPVKTDFGYHLIQLDDIVEQDYPDFDSQREALTEKVKRAMAADLFAEQALELERSAYDEQYALEGTAQLLGVELDRASQVTRNNPPDGIFEFPAVVSALFSDEVLDGTNSEAITVGEDQIVVVRVAEQHAPELRPLTDVADSIRAEIVRERALAAIETFKVEALQRLQDGESTAAIAADAGASWQSVELAGRSPRTQADASVPNEVRQYAFELPRPPAGEKSAGMVDLSTGAALVTVTRVVPGDLNTTSQAEVDEIRRVVEDRAARLDFQSLVQAAEGAIGVERPQLSGSAS